MLPLILILSNLSLVVLSHLVHSRTCHPSQTAISCLPDTTRTVHQISSFWINAWKPHIHFPSWGP